MNFRRFMAPLLLGLPPLEYITTYFATLDPDEGLGPFRVKNCRAILREARLLCPRKLPQADAWTASLYRLNEHFDKPSQKQRFGKIAN